MLKQFRTGTTAKGRMWIATWQREIRTCGVGTKCRELHVGHLHGQAQREIPFGHHLAGIPESQTGRCVDSDEALCVEASCACVHLELRRWSDWAGRTRSNSTDNCN